MDAPCPSIVKRSRSNTRMHGVARIGVGVVADSVRAARLPALSCRLCAGVGDGVDVGTGKPQMLTHVSARDGASSGFAAQPGRPHLQEFGGLLCGVQNRPRRDIRVARSGVFQRGRRPWTRRGSRRCGRGSAFGTGATGDVSAHGGMRAHTAHPRCSESAFRPGSSARWCGCCAAANVLSSTMGGCAQGPDHTHRSAATGRP